MKRAAWGLALVTAVAAVDATAVTFDLTAAGDATGVTLDFMADGFTLTVSGSQTLSQSADGLGFFSPGTPISGNNETVSFSIAGFGVVDFLSVTFGGVGAAQGGDQVDVLTGALPGSEILTNFDLGNGPTSQIVFADESVIAMTDLLSLRLTDGNDDFFVTAIEVDLERIPLPPSLALLLSAMTGVALLKRASRRKA